MNTSRFSAILILVFAVPIPGMSEPPTNHGINEVAGEIRRLNIGIDHDQLFKSAISGNPLAVKLFCWLAAYGRWDGATGEAYCDELGQILQKVGDRKFADVVTGMTLPERRAVAHSLGADGSGVSDLNGDVSRKYAATKKALSK